jgi:hypothetical protein
LKEKLKRVTSVDGITNPYGKRILSNVIGKDPMKVLARTPRRLRQLVKGLKKKQLRYQPAPGRWSIAHIINHLADAELAGAFRLRMMVSQSGSPILAYDQDAWANALGYDQADVEEKIKLFSTVRNSQLAIWQSLHDDDWERFGMHAERGKETVERFAQLHAGHDINHINQIEAIRGLFKKKKKK